MGKGTKIFEIFLLGFHKVKILFILPFFINDHQHLIILAGLADLKK